MSAASDAQTVTVEELSKQLAQAQKENEAYKRLLKGKRRDWRNIWAKVCLGVGVVVIIPASMLLWANRTLTNTDQYVATVGPIIHDVAVQQAIVKSVTTAIYGHVNIQQEVANLLPPKADVLAGPITSQVKGYINTTVAKMVASQQFANLWVDVNRRLQSRFIQIANSGNTSDVVDVNRLYQFVSSQLASTPLSGLTGKQLPPKIGQIKIATIPALAKIPRFVSTLSSLAWVFLGAAVALLIGAMALARDRRKMAMQIGFGWAIATVVSLLILRIVRGIWVGQITDPTYQQAAIDVWHALLTPFYLQTAILFVLGLILMAVGWFSGPAPIASKMRDGFLGFLAGGRTKLIPAAEQSALVRFLRRKHVAALWTLVLLTIGALLLLVPLTLVTLLVVLAGALVVWLALEFLSAPVRRPAD